MGCKCALVPNMFSKKDRTLLNPFCLPGDLNPCLAQKPKSRIVWIGLAVYNPGDLSIDQHLGAQDAGLVSAVEGGSLRCSHRAVRLVL